MKNPDVIEYVPVARASGAKRRVVLAFGLLAVAFYFGWGWAQGNAAANGVPADMTIFWPFLSIVCAGIAGLTAFFSWVFTGRPW